MVVFRTFSELNHNYFSAMHVAYYTIQNNPSLVAPHQRQELFYVRWLKEKIPALRPYGVTDDKTPKADQ
ncbi:Complex I-B8 [Caenorhabditis elegans]|uniref:Complex I-B8 n=1 Tax=Caenorhabditis elegans TaxID=6239 RepID=H8ESF0_CAEEL|nr:Complex I-B8 [Caenorhabditis elegans]CCG28178.1 Complex I-B8 [Caenorhabditis elegans]|eukprot:NP_001255381.1 Uncharacterized protein CELE_Y11D7A.10 [Caenorhabditis elegans]